MQPFRAPRDCTHDPTGWCVGVIKSRNTDRRHKVGGGPVNFLVTYKVDGPNAPPARHVLKAEYLLSSLADISTACENHWVLVDIPTPTTRPVCVILLQPLQRRCALCSHAECLRCSCSARLSYAVCAYAVCAYAAVCARKYSAGALRAQSASPSFLGP